MARVFRLSPTAGIEKRSIKDYPPLRQTNDLRLKGHLFWFIIKQAMSGRQVEDTFRGRCNANFDTLVRVSNYGVKIVGQLDVRSDLVTHRCNNFRGHSVRVIQLHKLFPRETLPPIALRQASNKSLALIYSAAIFCSLMPYHINDCFLSSFVQRKSAQILYLFPDNVFQPDLAVQPL